MKTMTTPSSAGRPRSWRARNAILEADEYALREFVSGRVVRPALTHPGLSMFSNAGIGDFGYRTAGVTFHAHAELVKERLNVCKLNHPVSAAVEGDLTQKWAELVERYQEREDRAPFLLAAMPPCQGMSSASNALRSSGRLGGGEVSADQRNALSFVVAKVAARLKPLFVVVENVPGILYTKLRDPDSGDIGTVAALLKKKMRGYDAYAATIQFADYGVPQRRLRTLLTFVRSESDAAKRLRRGKKAPFPKPTHSRHALPGRLKWVTVRSYLEAQWLEALTSSPGGSNASTKDSLHFVPRYDERRFLWVKSIPPHTGRGAFQNGCVECGLRDVPMDRVTCPDCSSYLVARPHVPLGGDKIRLIHGHSSSYRRMPSDLPATTITTATGHLGSDSNLHPWENRLLSPRECCLLQTVPMTFRWTESGELPPATHLRDMIGEALPPWYSYKHGLVLRVVAGKQSLDNLLDADAPEVQTLELESLEELQADRRRRLEARRRVRNLGNKVNAAGEVGRS